MTDAHLFFAGMAFGIIIGILGAMTVWAVVVNL